MLTACSLITYIRYVMRLFKHAHLSQVSRAEPRRHISCMMQNSAKYRIWKVMRHSRLHTCGSELVPNTVHAHKTYVHYFSRRVACDSTEHTIRIYNEGIFAADA